MLLDCPDFDPNTWRPSEHEFRIYGDDRLTTWAFVDAEDYWHFSRWLWRPTKPSVEHRRKVYMRRTSHGGRYTFYLHVEIMNRIAEPPTPAHVIVDHKNGRGLDCRRSNLRWATVSENNRNLFGSYARQADAFAVPGM